jgi:hypothetical protein
VHHQLILCKANNWKASKKNRQKSCDFHNLSLVKK